jgi:hypothetical protein
VSDAAKVSIRPQGEEEFSREVNAADDEEPDEPPKRRRRGEGAVQPRGTFDAAVAAAAAAAAGPEMEDEDVTESVRAARGGKDAVIERAEENVETSREKENVVDFEELSSEARKLKMQTPLIKPSDEEKRQHRLTHCPFRSWCPECVSGAANMDSHFARGAQ